MFLYLYINLQKEKHYTYSKITNFDDMKIYNIHNMILTIKKEKLQDLYINLILSFILLNFNNYHELI